MVEDVDVLELVQTARFDFKDLLLSMGPLVKEVAKISSLMLCLLRLRKSRPSKAGAYNALSPSVAIVVILDVAPGGSQLVIISRMLGSLTYAHIGLLLVRNHIWRFTSKHN
jgi:hypothetical protein